MSYDLEAYRLPPGLSEKALTKLLEEGEAEERALPLPADEREQLASALHALDASAERIELEGGVELFTDTMQLFIDESGVTINIPYHGLGDAGNTTMGRAFAYADAMTAHGLTVWDPQSEMIVGEDTGDRRAATDRFAATSELVEELGESSPAPRWKFWKR